jgi:transcriptional regulator with XRE-family HTH domain
MNKVDLGKRLRIIRNQKKTTLRNLSEKSQCSINYLSQVERGLNSPTIETLIRITGALDIKLNDLFSEDQVEELPIVIRKGERKSFYQDMSGVTYHALGSSAEQEFLDTFIIRLSPGANTGNSPHKEEGTEFLFVLAGQIELIYMGHSLQLSSGDSISFNCGKPHYFKNTGSISAEVISVAAPPRY